MNNSSERTADDILAEENLEKRVQKYRENMKRFREDMEKTEKK